MDESDEQMRSPNPQPEPRVILLHSQTWIFLFPRFGGIQERGKC